MWLKKVSVGYVSRSCDLPKKEIFDGLHKCLKNAYGGVFPKKEILIAYISDSKMVLVKITKKGNYQKRKLPKKGNFLKRKLYARKFGKMPEKSSKNTEKIPTGLESPQNSK